MTKQVYLILITGLLFVASCKKECRVVKERYLDKKEKIVAVYPDCNDTSYYLQQTFHHNGKLSREGHFKNDRMEGNFQTWAENGTLTGSWQVVDGLASGLVEYWYDNGNKKEEIDLYNGLQKTWYQNGQQQSEGHFIGDKEEGIWTFWDVDGKLAATEEYKDGVMTQQTLVKK